jgi:maleate cis-trans isomerase
MTWPASPSSRRRIRIGLIVPSSNTTMETELPELFRLLTRMVVDYLADLGIDVVDAVSLGVADNRAVGRLDPADLIGLVGQLDVRRAEAVVLSACVQMPSLPAIPQVEKLTGLPVLSAATATARQVLGTLGLEPAIDGAARCSTGGFDGNRICERCRGLH